MIEFRGWLENVFLDNSPDEWFSCHGRAIHGVLESLEYSTTLLSKVVEERLENIAEIMNQSGGFMLMDHKHKRIHQNETYFRFLGDLNETYREFATELKCNANPDSQEVLEHFGMIYADKLTQTWSESL